MTMKIMDVRGYNATSRKLAAAIEEIIGNSQVAIENKLPMLPNYIIMTKRQYRDFRRAHKIKDLGFGLMYVTKYNVMDIEIREVE